MRILAIDTALAVCAAAVLNTEDRGPSTRETVPMLRGQAEALMPMIARVMDKAEIEFAELDRIAVTIGPGSFTGLRVGISAARGIALAAAKPAIGLSTLAAYAAPYIAKDDTQPVAAVIDARHDHVYLQIVGPGGRSIVPPRITPVGEAVRAIAGLGSVRLVGGATNLILAAWPAGEPLPAVVDMQAAPDIDWVARLGAAAVEAQGPPKPLYLRAADAQPQHASRLLRR
jgi:tRNA threonylcarbamoyl adenosine modification protein YeaZ